MSTIVVLVPKSSHANFDSLPLRYGIHFLTDQKLELQVLRNLGRDPSYPDRFHVEANFLDPTNPNSKLHQGHFVLGERSHDVYPTLVTVWRGDRDTEWGLSNTMTALRKDGFVTVAHLLEMHPLYMAGKVIDSVGLMKYLSTSIAQKDIARFERVAMEAREETARAIKNMELARQEAEAARSKAAHMEKVALEAIDAVEGLEIERASQEEKIAELEARIKEGEARYKLESEAAQRDNSVATLSMPDLLVEVKEDVIVKGSSCTVLLLGDGTQRHMKTATFDRDRSITQKAKSLVGMRVKTTCWDPIREPGKWSRQGYFRNIYEAK